MRQKISMILAIIGLVIILLAFTTSGNARMVAITLGIIIACGGCLLLIASGKYSTQHRSMLMLITVLFILLIIGFVIKVTRFI